MFLTTRKSASPPRLDSYSISDQCCTILYGFLFFCIVLFCIVSALIARLAAQLHRCPMSTKPQTRTAAKPTKPRPGVSKELHLRPEARWWRGQRQVDSRDERTQICIHLRMLFSLAAPLSPRVASYCQIVTKRVFVKKDGQYPVQPGFPWLHAPDRYEKGFCQTESGQ